MSAVLKYQATVQKLDSSVILEVTGGNGLMMAVNLLWRKLAILATWCNYGNIELWFINHLNADFKKKLVTFQVIQCQVEAGMVHSLDL